MSYIFLVFTFLLDNRISKNIMQHIMLFVDRKLPQTWIATKVYCFKRSVFIKPKTINLQAHHILSTVATYRTWNPEVGKQLL